MRSWESQVLTSHLNLLVLPVGQSQGLDFGNFGDVAMDSRAVQTDEHTKGAGAPTRICRRLESQKKKNQN